MDIYKEGFIFTDCKDVKWRTRDAWFSFKEKIKITGKHPFLNGEDVTGKYETENVCNAPYCECSKGIPSYCRFNSQGKTIARAKKAQLSEPKVE